MGRQSVMLYAAGDRRYDDCGTMAITYVVLNNQHRSDASLLGAAHRFKIRIEYVSAVCGVDVVIIHSSFRFSPATNEVKESAQAIAHSFGLRGINFPLPVFDTTSPGGAAT